MNRKFNVTLIIVLIVFSAFAQQNTFRKDYAFSTMDITGGMIECSAGGYVFCGFNTNWIPIYGNITRIDQYGNLVWSKGVLGSIATAFTDVIEISASLGGGFLLAGESSPGAILVRVDNNGNLVWARRYQYPSSGGEFFNKVIQTNDGSFLACGGVNHFWDGAVYRDSLMPMAIKVDQSNGNIIWDRVYYIAVSNPDEHCFTDVTETADGYVFVGYTSEGTGTISSEGDYPRDGLIIKTNSSGTLTYAHKFGASAEGQGIESAKTLSTGNVLIGGYRGDQGMLLRFNGTGTPGSFSYGHRYSKTYSMIFPEPVYFTDVMEMTDGHYATIGTYIRPLILPFEIYSTTSKFNNSTGAVMSGQTFVPAGTLPISFSILPEGGRAADNSYFMFMTSMNGTGYNYHVLKTDASGSMNNPACPEGSYSPDRSGYTPALTTFSPTVHSSLAGATTFTPAINNLTPTVTTICQYSPCTPPPDPTVGASPNPICAGQSVTLTASGSGSNVTYYYYTVPVGGTEFATGPSTVVNPGSTTTYYIAAEDNTQPGCFSNRIPVTVTVNPLPNPNISSNSPVCVGESINLGASNGTNGYLWSGPNGFSSPAQNPTISPANTSHSGTYSVTVTDGNNCSNTASVVVTVNTNPSVNLGPDTTICSGDNLTLDAGAGFTGYSWLPSGSTQTINVTTGGTYSVTVTDGNTCQGSDAINVTVITQADATITTTDVEYCSNESAVNFSATDPGGTWSGQGITSGGLFSPSSAGPGTHTITYTISGACGDSDNINITVFEAPTINLGPDTSLCIGEILVLDAGAGFSSYNWSPSGSTQTISVTTNGTYTVTVTDGNNCQGTDAITVAFTGQQDATIVSTGPYCLNDMPITFTAVDGGGSWSGNGITSGGLFTPSVAGTGTHEIIYTIPGGCGDSDTIEIIVFPVPAIVFVSTNASCIGASDGMAMVNVSDGTPPYTFLWSNSEITDSVGDLSAGTYSLTVTDYNNCSTENNITILDGIEDCFIPHIYVPNVFSPNGDGENDVLFVRGEGIQYIEFVIYDRWGEKIFETTSKDIGWDGTYKGKACPPAVFAWYVKVTFVNNEEQTINGNTTLVR
jgi:gliding motility-associated-like protein